MLDCRANPLPSCVERGVTKDGFAEKAGGSSRYVARVEAGQKT
jgi:hypothetical protein